jgi:hypothetical protein
LFSMQRYPTVGSAEHMQQDMMGLLHINVRREPLRQAQPVSVHALVDGDTEIKTGEVRWWLTLATPTTLSSVTSASARPTVQRLC